MKSILSAVLMTLLPLSAVHAAGVEMEAPATLNFAGAKLALPKKFTVQSTSEFNTALRAVKLESDQPTVAVTLSAWAIGGDLALDKFVDMVHPRKNLTIRGLRVLTAKSLKVAGLDGEVQVQTYTLRAIDTTAVRLFFKRDCSDGKTHLGYVLAVEADKAHAKDALPTLSAVAGTLELFDPVRQSGENVSALADESVSSQRYGYTLKPPLWWKCAKNTAGDSVEMYQADYFLGQPMPEAIMTVKLEQNAAETCSEKELKKQLDKLRKDDADPTVIRNGEAKMAGQQAWEFVISYRVFTETGQQKAIVCQRTACVNGLSYSLWVRSQGPKLEDIKAPTASVVDTIATGMTVSVPAAGATTTTTAPTTGEAPATSTSGPSSSPPATSGAPGK